MIKRVVIGFLVGFMSISAISCSKSKTEVVTKTEEICEDNEDYEYDQHFAGTYYGENGGLTCCYKDELELVKKRYPNMKNPFVQVDYSVNDLNDAMAEVVKLIGQYGINEVALSYKKNAVVVKLINYDEIDELKKVVTSGAIIYEQQVGTITY